MIFKKKKAQATSCLDQNKSPTELVKETLDELEETIRQKRDLLNSAQRLTKQVVDRLPQRRKLSA